MKWEERKKEEGGAKEASHHHSCGPPLHLHYCAFTKHMTVIDFVRRALFSTHLLSALIIMLYSSFDTLLYLAHHHLRSDLLLRGLCICPVYTSLIINRDAL